MEIKVTKSNFEQDVLKNELLVLVDFWASWCYPCRMLGQELEEIEKQLDGKMVVAKVNVDEENELAYAFKVSSIPMVVLFKNGQMVTQFIGYKSKDEILKEILPYLD